MATSQTVIVTGASSGIGASTARAFAREGHRVFAIARRADRLERLASEYPQITPIVADVTDVAEVAGAIRAVGAADILVNNAGFAAAGPIEAVSAAETQRQFDVNVFGLLHTTRAALPAMRERGSGRIINISSVVGRVTFPGMGIYSASKHAVESLSDALRAELRPFGIDVALIEPGFIRTEIGAPGPPDPDAAGGAYRTLSAATGSFLSREVAGGGDPDDLANLIVRVGTARRVRARYLYPAKSRVLVGTLGRLPERIADGAKLRAIGAAQ